MTSRVRPYLALLRANSAFRRVYAAQLISFAGDWFAQVALLGMALELSGSPVIASLVLVLQTGGYSLVAPIGGTLADRFDRKKLMIAADVARVPICLSFLLVTSADMLWFALVANMMLSVFGAVFEPASSAALPNLVDDDELSTANVLLGSAWGVMLAVGAALGGIVAATLGRDAAFVIDGASFALSAALMIGVTRPFQRPRVALAPGEHQPGLFGSIRPVIHFASHSRFVSSLLLTKTLFGVGTGVIVLLAVFGGQVFGAGDVGIGLLFAARGLGALIGPFLAKSTFGTSDRGLLVGISISIVGVVIAYSLFPLAPTILIAAVLVFAAHLGSGAQWMLSTFGLQRHTPDAIRGRVFSFDYALVTLAIAVSNIVAGILAQALTPQAAVWTMVALLAVAGTAWFIFSAPARRLASRAAA